MDGSNAIAELDDRIRVFYGKFSAKRVAFATLVVGILSVSASLAVYVFTMNPYLAAGVFGAASLVLVNVAMLTIVPPTKDLEASRRFIMGAVRDPERIASCDAGCVKLADDSGNVRSLRGYEQTVWKSIVVAYLTKINVEEVSRARRRSSRRLTESEKRQMEERRKRIADKETNLKEERERLQKEREEIERRSKELEEAENLVVDRLTKVETAEAELTQLRYEVDERAKAAERGSGSGTDGDAKERELREKEAELERLKLTLAEDREAVRAQKTELNQLKGELLQQYKGGEVSGEDGASDGAGEETDPIAERERKLEERARELDAAARELDERSRYVDDAENSLIERLNQMSEREASVEQSEINAGLKSE